MAELKWSIETSASLSAGVTSSSANWNEPTEAWDAEAQRSVSRVVDLVGSTDRCNCAQARPALIHIHDSALYAAGTIEVENAQSADSLSSGIPACQAEDVTSFQRRGIRTRDGSCRSKDPEPRIPELSNSMNWPAALARLRANLNVWFPAAPVNVITPRLSFVTWYVPVKATFAIGPLVRFTSSVPRVMFPFPSAIKIPVA